MGFWKGLAKVGIMAAPYVAAPFTGGASLLAVPAANRVAGAINTGNRTFDTAANIGGAAASGYGGGGGAGGYGGGGSGNILTTAGKITAAAAPAAEALAAGRAQGRIEEGVMNQRQDQNALQRYRDQLAASDSQNRYNQNTAAFGLSKAETDLARRNYVLAAPGKRASNSVRGDVLANAQDAHFSNLPKGVTVPTLTGGLRPSMFSANTRTLGGLMSSQALQQQQAGDNFEALPDMPGYTAPPPAPGLTPLPSPNVVDKILTTTGTIGSLASTIPDYQQILAKYRRKPAGTNVDAGDWETGGVG